jgi:hypothetical protein
MDDQHGTSWPYYYDITTDTAYERILGDYWPMLPVQPCSRNKYEFSNDYPENMPLLPLPITATPATLTTRTSNSITLSISSARNRQTVTQSTSTARSIVSTSARSRTIPSKIPVTHLPPWEQPFLRHNHRLPTIPSWPPASFPDITVGLTSKKDGDTTLYAWYTPFAGEPLLSGWRVLHLSHHEHWALQLPCTPPFVCLQLLIPPALWSTIKTITAIQIQDIDPFYNSIQLDRRPSPPVTPLHSILCLEDAPPQSPFQHQIHHPATCRHAKCHHCQPISSGRPRASNHSIHLPWHPKSPMPTCLQLRFQQSASPLRIANAAVVSGIFRAAITTAHRLRSLRLHQCTRNKWTASTYPNIHWSAFSRSFERRKKAPAAKNLQRLATRRSNPTPHQPRFPRLLPYLLRQKRNLRPHYAMPQSPSRRTPLLTT